MKKTIIILSMIIAVAGCTASKQEMKKDVALIKEVKKAEIIAEAKRPDKPSKKDNFIFKERIEHNANEDFLVVNSEKSIRFILKARSNDVEKIELLYNDGTDKKAEMKSLGTSGMAEYFAADVVIDSGRIKYCFEMKDGSYIYYFGKKGGDSKETATAFEYNLDSKFIPETPEWAKKVVWYQIFTDRFKNGNKDNDPIYNEFGPQSFNKPTAVLSSGTPISSLVNEEQWNSRTGEVSYGDFTNNKWKSDWNVLEPWEKDYAGRQKDKESYTGQMRHYGGDLEGVISKLDYLKEVGITAIWFNPVFYAESNHKYDAADFRHIDPSFGFIEDTGNTDGITVSSGNKYGGRIFSEKGNSEYKALSYDINTGKNIMGETSDPATWAWTESDILASKMIKEAHKRGIRVIFDGVFNHTGNEFWAFTQAIIEGPSSKYAGWYKFLDWRKVKEYNADNQDLWNPGVVYNGSAVYGVFDKDGKKLRRKWVETPKDASPADKWEIYLWNKEKVEYESWWGFRSLPKLDHFNEEVGKYMVNISKKWMLGPDGVVSENWQEDDGIDGWRLDVPLDIENQNFWLIWKKEIRDVKKDAYVSAEIWDTARSHVYGKKFDAVMNYEFSKTVLKYVVNTGKKDKLKASEFAAEENMLFKGYADDSAAAMQNLMDSHDTDRIFSMIINPNRDYNSGARLNETKSYKDIRPDLYSSDAVAKLKIISLIQLTYTGAPMIYYGDEAGIWGAADPHDRKPMMWPENMPFDKATDGLEKYKQAIASGKMSNDIEIDEQNKVIKYSPIINSEIQEWYKKIIAIRNSDIELYGTASLSYLVADDEKDAVAFERKLNERSSITVVNNSDKKQTIEIPLENGKDYTDLINGKSYAVKDGKMSVDMEPKSATVLYKK